LNHNSFIFSESKACVFKPFSLLYEIADDTRIFFPDKPKISWLNKVMNFIEQVFNQLDLLKELLVFYNSCSFIDFVIIHRVLDFEISLLHDTRYFFEFIVSLFRVVQHNSIENFGQVCVQI